jgi:hypothetical protein
MSRVTDHPYLGACRCCGIAEAAGQAEDQRLEFLAEPARDAAEWPRSRESCWGTCEICA